MMLLCLAESFRSIFHRILILKCEMSMVRDFEVLRSLVIGSLRAELSLSEENR